MNVYQQRRDAFARAIGDAVAVIPAAHHALRNADTEYEYRQDSDFFYLTGFTEPESVLVICGGRSPRDILFLRPLDRTQEIWTGRRLGVDAAVAALGVDAAHEIGRFSELLADSLVGSSALYYNIGGGDEAFDRTMTEGLRAARARVRRGGIAPAEIVAPGVILHEMRVRKDDEELAIMRRAAQITRAGHEAALRATAPGVWEYELEAAIEATYRKLGAQDVAYPSIVAGGDNALILHYNTNRAPLRAGELVLVDSGCELDCYASDVTRTWPVNGRFSAEQRTIYELVLTAQKAAIDKVRPGHPYDAAHQTATRVLAEGLIELGLLKGSVDEAIETRKIIGFYPHGTGHWLGLDVHDAGRYRDRDDRYRPLEENMIVTIEPGCYVQRDLDCDERFKGIGIRIEDDVRCTASDPEVLTAAIPKEIDELEALIGADLARSGG